VSAPSCFHCGNLVPPGCEISLLVDDAPQWLCCSGCEAAARFILSQGLGRYYQFREPAHCPPADELRDWLIYDRSAALGRYTHLRADGTREVAVQLEGLHCAACVWLIENSLTRLGGALDISVNLVEGRAQIRFDPQQVLLSALLRGLQKLGYLPRPVSFADDSDAWNKARGTALRRLAVAGFGMMQVMTFAVSLYAGALDGIAPNLEQLLRIVSLVVATPVVLYAAQPFFASAWRSIQARTLGMDVPVALSIGAAYLWSAWATLVGHGTVYFDSAVMFTFFLLLGRYLEMSLRHRAGRQQDSLRRLLPESVLRLSVGQSERVTPDELQPGDRIRVLPGERLPAEGVITSGTSEIDESLLNGESTPRTCRPGDFLITGSLNLNGVIEVLVARVGQDTTLAAISRLLDRAHASRPAVAAVADRVAAWFVGGILLVAAAVGVYWWHFDAQRAFSTVLAVLVVTCPCALSLATPAALAAATTQLARNGLLVSRSSALERLARADRIVFDKTGTLTRGQPRLESVTLVGGRLPQARCLEIAATLESYSTHPIARAFAACRPAPGGAVAVKVVPGQGIEGRIDGVSYRIGCADYAWAVTTPQQALATAEGGSDHLTSVWLADSDGVVARFLMADEFRADAKHSVERLRARGLTPQIASGDRPSVVSACGQRLGIQRAQGGLTAGDKLTLMQRLHQRGHRVVMVGDGVNDAPVLAGADVSVAIGSGTELARVSADVILLGDGLGGLVAGVDTARRMLTIIRENLTWAVIYNVTAVPLAASGVLQPWMAAIGMSMSSLLVVLNALRILSTPLPRTLGTPVLNAPEVVHA
jgi:P-type Cu2+ transporter